MLPRNPKSMNEERRKEPTFHLHMKLSQVDLQSSLYKAHVLKVKLHSHQHCPAKQSSCLSLHMPFLLKDFIYFFSKGTQTFSPVKADKSNVNGFCKTQKHSIGEWNSWSSSLPVTFHYWFCKNSRAYSFNSHPTLPVEVIRGSSIKDFPYKASVFCSHMLSF